jgi:predicted MFS family arabinose efflux permease
VQARTSWLGVSTALLVGVVAAGYVGKLPPALPALKAEFGLSLVAAGWVVSTFNTVALATAVAFGLAADRIGAFRFALAGLALLVVGGVGGAAAPSGAGLIVSRVVEGAGLLAVTVAGTALVFAATAPGDRKLALGIWSTYFPFGMAIAMAAAPLAIDAIGWRGLWLVIAAATLASAAALASQRRRYPPAPASGRTFSAILAALRQPGPWWNSLVMTFYTLQWSGVMVWLPTFLVQTRGASLIAASLVAAVVVAVNVPGNLTGAWLMQRQAPRGLIVCVAAGLMGAFGIGIFAEGAPDWLRLGSCLAFSYFSGVIPAVAFAAPQTYARAQSQVASLQGLMMQGSNLGQFVGPPAIAAAVSASGRWGDAMYVMVAAAALTLVCGLAVARDEVRVRDERRPPVRAA